ncbi:Swt1 family HEPN domain-containing protein [Burkholderia lata]|uniref:Swt1 family HEPN domain-containing protein n=1 Tax=Burkholderia lata (strain ATCC 17760 / DSM 23089 / LMG 22485 / NCIMB 9086 / R18194 / 383) TaxID=482957 RepID=UPI001582C1B1|nr:Swt1 family HEPN domain-containing protein [Burkholderia lata]
MNDQRLALFLMLGQTASRDMQKLPGLVPPEPLRVSESHDLAATMPEVVREAIDAAEVYKLFYVFENYLRDFAVEVLSNDGQTDWWPKIPKDVQDEIVKLEETEEAKSWMALGSRDKSSLMTYPQILRVIDHCWKSDFEDLIRDRALIQEARMAGHLRNAICHMSSIPDEEVARVRQVMRDWFRRIAP